MFLITSQEPQSNWT